MSGFLQDPSVHPSGNDALPYLLIVVSLAFGWILLPFYGTLLWGVVIALLFSPVQQWLLIRLNFGRSSTAALTLLIAFIIVILPFSLLSAALAREAFQVYERLQSGEWQPVSVLRSAFEQLPAWILVLLDRFGIGEFNELQNRVTTTLAQTSRVIATRVLSVGQNSFEFVLSFFITMYIAFFLIRDGNRLVSDIRRAIPLEPVHKKELLAKFATVIRATVKGNLLVAVIQGALGGIAFWMLDVSAVMLWAMLMAFLSLLPAIGAALVWLPVALYFIINGEILSGVGLIAWGVLVIGMADNLLRPILVGKDTGMPDYVVMVSTLGGMAAIGINGFVVGPAIAAIFIAVWHIYVVTRADYAASETKTDSTSDSTPLP